MSKVSTRPHKTATAVTKTVTAVATAASAVAVSTVEAPASFNAKQLALILETIAGKARTLQQMLMLLQGATIEDEYAQSVCIDAATDLATAIGAIADEAIGGCVIGNAACWHFGPNFDGTEKAVAA